MLRHRWRFVTIIVVVAVAVAIGAATLRNRSIEPLMRAEAPVTFLTGVSELEDREGQLLESVQAELEDARVRAISVNSDVLTDPGNEIQVDPTLGRLVFIARAESADEAIATASQMRGRLLTRQPVNMENQIAEQIELVTSQMDEVRAQIAELDAEAALPPEVIASRDRLTTLLGQLEVRALELEQSLLVPSAEDVRTPEEIEAELTEVEAAIDRVTTELAALPPALSEFSPEMTERRALERQYRELETSYQELILQRAEFSGPPVVELVDVFDETPAAVPRRLAGAVALLIGVVLAAIGLFVVERFVRPVWFPRDLPDLSFLPEVPTRPLSNAYWYFQSGSSERKSAIQALRSSVRARASDDEFIVAVVGAGIGSDDVHALGADLASSFTSAQVPTALIDAAFDNPSRQPEYSRPAFSLGDVVHTSNADQVHGLVDEATLVDDNRGLLRIAPGHDIDAPADHMAGPRIGHLFDALREIRDVIVVVCDDVNSPAARALLDRSDLGLLVTAPGASTYSALKRIADEMSYRRIDLAGVMVEDRAFPIVGRIAARLREIGGRMVGEARPSPDGVAAGRSAGEPLQRDLHAGAQLTRSNGGPLPSAASGEADLDQLAETVPQSDSEVASSRPSLTPVSGAVQSDRDEKPAPKGDADSPAAMMAALEEGEPKDLLEGVESFLASWVTRIVLAGEEGTLHPDTVATVRTVGFVPLSTWKGHPSIGARLRLEFGRILGKRSASRLEELLLRSISDGNNPSDATSLDRWVGRHYFRRHAEEEDWEPRVWHLTSARGTISALIAAERFDRDRVESFVDTVVIRAINRLARRQRRKEMVGDRSAAELEELIEDVRGFGLALAWLMDGSHEDSRLRYPSLDPDEQPEGWHPDWHHGIKSNIAPLQRMGILAIPVLTDQELASLEATG